VRNDLLLWLDLETTGLDPEAPGARILEVAAVVTDEALVRQGSFEAVLQFEDTTMISSLEPRVREMHERHGLLAECVGAGALALDEVQGELIGLLAGCRMAPGTAPLCGSTISFDRAWLKRFMPKVNGLLHYRNIDVTTVKRLARMWRPDLIEPKKADRHRAMSDILESIAELRFYRDLWLQPQQSEFPSPTK